jgi:hypothetical protein
VFPNQGTGEKQPRSMWANCLIGCLVVFAVLVVLGILVAVWVSRNLHKWAADFGTLAVNQAISESDLPAKEKDEMREQTGRVATALREGKITMGQAGEIVQKVFESPLMPTLVVGAVDKQYLQRSGLTEAEKAEGRLSLKRFARGTLDKKIDQTGIDAVLAHVADRDAEGQWQLRSVVSDEDLRAALAEAKSQADKAGIVPDPEDIDASGELKRIIDDALGEPAAAAAVTPAESTKPANSAEATEPAP